MSKTKAIGMDTGASGWKIGMGSLQFYLPSLVTRGPIRDEVNGVFTSERSQESVDNIAVNLEKGLYYVGNIAKYSHVPPLVRIWKRALYLPIRVYGPNDTRRL